MFNWKIKESKGKIYQGWHELPFRKYLQLIFTEDRKERLCILTGCTMEQLKDVKFMSYMESLTIWSLVPYESVINNTIVYENESYIFPESYDLLNQTYDQFAYVDQVLQPVYSLVEELDKENKKEKPDAKVIQQITDEHTQMIVRSYNYLIAAYLNVGRSDKEFNSDLVSVHAEKLLDYPCTEILNLGGFFLDCSIKLRSNKTKLSLTQGWRMKSILENMRKQATHIYLKFGVLCWLLLDYVKRITTRLSKFGIKKLKK